MTSPPGVSGWDRASRRVVLGLCGLKALVQLACVSRYGYHGDELYFIECGRHLAFGYVDHPPLIPWIARVADELGGSLVALRLPAIAAGVGTMALSALLVREWGGGWRAQFLTLLCLLVAPAHLRMAAMLDIPVVEVFLCTFTAYLVARALSRRERWTWVLAGGALGLANMTNQASSTGSDPNSVRKLLSVQAPQAVAWRVFTEKMGTWWPLASYKIGKAAAVDAVIEPRVGGRWYERGDDGSTCDWGSVLAWEPPSRLVLSWDITADWQYDPALKTEIEVRFIPEGNAATRVELEHRRLDCYGARRDEMRTIFDSSGDWGRLLAAFAEAAVAR